MATIKLQKLSICDQAFNTPPMQLQFYNNIYVQRGDEIDIDSSRSAYWIVNEISARDLKRIFDELEAQGVNSLTAPITREENLVFHLSRGDHDADESASVFFRIYALTQAELTKLRNGSDAAAVEIINANCNGGRVRVKVKTLTGKTKEKIELNQSDFTIKIENEDYQLIFDVVGIGYHMSDRRNNKYRMVYYNDQVIKNPSIDLDARQ